MYWPVRTNERSVILHVYAKVLGIGMEDRSRIHSFRDHNSSLEGAMKLKPVPFCSPSEPISDEITDGWPLLSKFSDSGQKPWTIINRAHSLGTFCETQCWDRTYVC